MYWGREEGTKGWRKGGRDGWTDFALNITVFFLMNHNYNPGPFQEPL